MAIEGADLVKAAAFIGAGLSMGLGAIGPGVGEDRKKPPGSRPADPNDAGRPGRIGINRHLLSGDRTAAAVCGVSVVGRRTRPDDKAAIPAASTARHQYR